MSIFNHEFISMVVNLKYEVDLKKDCLMEFLDLPAPFHSPSKDI